MTHRVVVVGATGHIGRPLCRALVQAGSLVTVFSRSPDHARQTVPGAADYLAWGPAMPPEHSASYLEWADAVVCLAGGPLFDGRRRTREDVAAESRARQAALGQLVTTLGGLRRRPGMLIAASSAGYYGYAGSCDGSVDEAHPAGSDWWGRDSAAIEQAALAAQALGVRTVVTRAGYVLTPDSLAAQLAQFRRHFGGWIGTGRCWTPWIHIADAVGIITFALQQPGLDGPVNLAAPQPARARAFARALGRAAGRRAWLAVPTPLARMGLGVITDILVRGKHIVPARASGLSYQIRFPVLDAALRDLLPQLDDAAVTR